MSRTIKDKYIEPMAEKPRHSHKRDSGYGGSTSGSSHRHTGSRSSNKSNGSREYPEQENNMTDQRFNVAALQNALQASNESNEKLTKENRNLDKDLTESNTEKRRIRRERDAERLQNDELRASLTSAQRENERLNKELSKYQRDSGRDSRKSSSKSNSSAKEEWKKMPVPLYRSQSPSPVPEMPRNGRPPVTGNSRPTAQRRMSVSHTTTPYTYTVTPGNYDPYGSTRS